MYFIPYFPWHTNPFALFGLILLFGLLGGEIVHRIRFLPRITGYMAVGFLFGPGGLNVVNQTVLANTHIFVDISLGLILFELGRHLDFEWLRHDHGLLFTALAESALTFVSIFCILFLLAGFSSLSAAMAATMAVATSPAVVMMVAHDLSSEGPVTRRALILTSLNNLIAISIFTFLLPMTQSALSSKFILFLHGAYCFFGSIVLGLIMFWVTRLIGRLTGKHVDNQLVLFLGAVICAAGTANTLHLSTMLTLFVFGAAARNLDSRHVLMEIDFEWLARIFFILLFVVTGVHLQLQGLWEVSFIVVFIIAVRLLSKLLGVFLFAKSSHLTGRQALAISLTLLPMAGVSIGMSNTLIDFNPDFGNKLILIITAVVAILNIIGPILTQLAFIKTREALLE